jgi:hypothetical protein
MSHLLVTHQFSCVPNAERVKSAHEDVVRAIHARETPVQVANAFQRLENELRDFALWLGSDKVKEEWRQQRRIVTTFAAEIDRSGPTLDALPLSLDGKQALITLREAWKYARKTLSLG